MFFYVWKDDGGGRGGSFIHDIPYPDDTILRVRIIFKIIIYVYISLATIHG